MSSLRLLAWNCHHGGLDATLTEVEALSADVAFIQEWRPSKSVPVPPRALARIVGPHKGIALVAGAGVTLTPIPRRRGASRASLSASVATGAAATGAAATGAEAFNVIGLWAQGPHYSKDVLRTS